MPDRDPNDELGDRSGPRDVPSKRYRVSLPDTITVSWREFAEGVRAADASIEYIATIQRHLDELDRDHPLPRTNRWTHD